jgi:CHASE3 domain sensor protein
MVRRISERVIWVGAVAIVAILVAGSLTYSRVRLLSDATGWISRTEQVRYTLQRILGTLQNAESSVRGYLITREDPFLAPYIGVRAALETDLRSLTSLLAEDPAQQARARELERWVSSNGTFVYDKEADETNTSALRTTSTTSSPCCAATWL